MPHLSHGKTKTNVSTYLARSEIQAILGAFIILWSDQQYNQETEAHTRETDVCVCVGSHREIKIKTGLPGKDNLGTDEIFLFFSYQIDLRGDWPLIPEGYLKAQALLNELMCQRCSGQAAAGKISQHFFHIRRTFTIVLQCVIFPLPVGHMHMTDNGITFLFQNLELY